MKKILLGCGGAIVALVLILIVVGLFLPSTYSIEESVEIEASSAEIHRWVEDLEKWPAWAPWHKADPSIVTTFGTPTSGLGANQSWTSDDQGGGELTITASDPATGIAYDMFFIMDETRVPASAVMSYAASGASTTVTWSMEGDMADMAPSIMAGYLNIVMSGQIATMFQTGLADLKTTVEAGG